MFADFPSSSTRVPVAKSKPTEKPLQPSSADKDDDDGQYIANYSVLLSVFNVSQIIESVSAGCED